MSKTAEKIKEIADVLHQARFPRSLYGIVRCPGPKLCCSYDLEMARAVLRRYRLLRKA